MNALSADPSVLARHYTRFGVSERILLTGHSHQAWPDVAEEGLAAAFADAAELVDRKWGRAFEQAAQVQAGYARLMGCAPSLVLTASTHEAVLRFLSALPLKARPRLVTTDGEFHSLRRQLARLEEEGVDVVRVAALPVATLSERVAATVDATTAAVLISSVMFQSAHIVPGLATVAEACARHGAELLVDAYHHLNIVPFDLAGMGLERAFVTGGGYKYVQAGEGNCFLRVPEGTTLRPVITGWYAEFALLEGHADGVPYPPGAERFAGATYDPTSHYRGARVFRFFDELGLDVATLRATSQRQIGRLSAGFDALDLDPAVIDRDRWVPNESIGGFLALRSPRAAEITSGLAERGVSVDARGEIVRLGPAPYVTDRQLDDALVALREVVSAGVAETAG